MHTTAPATASVRCTRMMLGFYETTINGQPRDQPMAATRSASTPNSSCSLDDNVGIFVSFNRRAAAARVPGSAGRYVRTVRRPLFPGAARHPPRAGGQAAEHARHDGRQLGRLAPAPQSSFINVTELLGQTKVGRRQGRRAGPAAFARPGSTPERRWVEVEPVRLARSQQPRAARGAGRERPRWCDQHRHDLALHGLRSDALAPQFGAGCCRLLLASLAILSLTAIFWPVRWLVRRKFGATLALERSELLSYRLVRELLLADPARR